MQRSIAEQARAAIAEADLVAFVIDGTAGIGAGDEEIADLLRRAHKPVIVVANKLDNPRRHDEALELHRLGLGDPIAISALHGIGTGDLLDAVVERLGTIEGARHDERISDEIGVAILGRPNVGKSSLLNALLGAPRAIVSEIPGTTRDSIDIRLERDETRLPPDRHGRPAAARAATARTSSSGARCARSTPRAAPTSRSCWWTPTRASSTRTCTSPTRRARPAAPRSSCSASGTSRTSTSRSRASACTTSCASARR